LDVLRAISKNKNINNFQQLNEKNNVPCIVQEAWLTYLEPADEFLNIMKIHCGRVYSILTNEVDITI
jgi:hypothetical protein